MNNAGEDRLLTFQETADYLRISRPTLSRLVQEDKVILAVRVGYGWRFRKSDVEAYLRRQESGATPHLKEGEEP